VHENPERALSDGPNMLRLHELEKLLRKIKEIERIAGRL
jgi:3-deoxy-D-manno-octulosonic acid (KDO) 8-phosphate synthase